MHIKHVSLLLAFCLPLTAAAQPGSHVTKSADAISDFSLLDQKGVFHHLYYYAKDPRTRAMVIFVQGNGCPIVRKSVPELKRLRDAYAAKGVRFWMINANSQDLRAEVAEEAAEFGIDIPILLDETGIAAKALQVSRTGEVIVIEPDTWRIRYRGAIDDRFSYGSQKSAAEHEYLKDALDSLLAGEAVATEKTDAAGCAVTLAEPPLVESAYHDAIAPMLKDNCVRCHTKGGIGPFAMSNYKKVSGWSDMMREVLATKRMTPWQADPHVGAFANDFSLSADDTRTLVQWIDAGAPRGSGEDPLEGYQPDLPEWRLGSPDLIIPIPEQSVAAEGVFDYRYVVVDTPNKEDVWLRALETAPGNRRVLHHIIANSVPPEGDVKKDQIALTGYAPGLGPDQLPQGTGILLKAGSKIVFQLHYTASGKAETDNSRLGLYFAKTPPAKVLESGVVIHSRFRIPPGDGEFVATKSHKFDKDVLLQSMNPHMHLRGKWMRYSARYPDGSQELLLNVPDYRFDWQCQYELKDPKYLPAGTELVVEAAWDNSALNLNNPNPKVAVGWGDQTFNEMFYASFRFTAADPAPVLESPKTASAGQ